MLPCSTLQAISLLQQITWDILIHQQNNSITKVVMIKSFLQIGVVLFALFFVGACGKKSGEEYVKGDNLFNKGWEFVKDVDLPVGEIVSNEKLLWEGVSLPHSASIEPL